MSQDVTVTFLGGLGDIGRNCAAIETEDALLILDCGQAFASEERPGVDAILPDVDYLFERREKIVGAVISHGHEDHIGGIAHIVKRGLSFPIYGSDFTTGLIRYRLEERDLVDRVDLVSVEDNSTVDIGPFSVEFLPVTHSVPGGLIAAITTPQGLIVHSSDFKLDQHPVDDRRTDLVRLGSLADEPGIRLLLADSTNSDVEGSTSSESSLTAPLAEIFRQHSGRRIITACFSSHIHRVQQICDVAIEHGRKIATLGLSMRKNVALARSLGLLKIPDHAFFDLENLDDHQPGGVCIISTGSQGEDRSSLAVAAAGRSRWITIGDQDTVILSSHPIPGHEARVGNMINELSRRGAEVLHSGLVKVHTSGHGKRDELTTLHTVASPQYFVPVHGEYRHLLAHCELATSLGMPEDRVEVCVDGDQVVLNSEGLKKKAAVTSGDYMYLHHDFLRRDDGFLSERRILGDQGIVTVTVVIDFSDGRRISEPLVETRGWLHNLDADDISDKIIDAVIEAVDEELSSKDWNHDRLTRVVRRAAGSTVNYESRRRPMIMPIIFDI